MTASGEYAVRPYTALVLVGRAETAAQGLDHHVGRVQIERTQRQSLREAVALDVLGH